MKLRTALVAALCIGLVCGIATTSGYAQGGKITVLNPLGTRPPIEMKARAPRLDTLDGKTIYLVNTGFPNSGPFMQVVADWFKANHPKTKIEVRSQGMSNMPPALRAEIEKNADAVLFGLGH
jgi:ABC-type phosphate transport system substrate-binding protein